MEKTKEAASVVTGAGQPSDVPNEEHRWARVMVLGGGQAEEKCPFTKAVGKSAILPSLCPFLKLLLNKKSHPFRVFRGIKKLALGVFSALTPL